MDDHRSSGTQKALRAAAAAANIARGAATGGIYGAAAGAAKSFLPELALLLCMTVLVPMLVFTVLPNTMFGYDSASDQDIVDFTSSAHALDRLYQDLDRMEQSVIDRLGFTQEEKDWAALLYSVLAEEQSIKEFGHRGPGGLPENRAVKSTDQRPYPEV